MVAAWVGCPLAGALAIRYVCRGLLWLGSLGWARLDLTAGTPTGDYAWLHGNMILMAAAVVVLMTGGLAGWILPRKSDWTAPCRPASGPCSGRPGGSDAGGRARAGTGAFPTGRPGTAALGGAWAIAVVGAAMAGLVAGCLGLCLGPPLPGPVGTQRPRPDGVTLCGRGVSDVIYVSSTTEFWRNIGQSAVLPRVTILLAVLGVLAGILLRVQSFPHLGFTFLIVVIGRMIVYAAFEEKHIWVFWVSCIVLGTMILALFALFEEAAQRRAGDLGTIQAVGTVITGQLARLFSGPGWAAFLGTMPPRQRNLPAA